MTSNILGSIYTTTISAEKYIVISSQNIELSGNVIMKKQVTISKGLLNTNSLIPNVTNIASLGSTGNNWSNAYINDVSINNNLQVTGNVYISGNLEASNIYTKSEIDASFENLYTIDHIDNSFQNVYTRGAIDTSFANVYTSVQFDSSYANVYTRGHIDQSFSNVYTRIHIDNSFANVYTRGAIDQSFANIYTRGLIDLSFANVYTRGHIDQSFANVYTRIYIDQSFANVYTRGVIDTSFANIYTRIQVDNSFVTKRVVELSLNALPTSSGGGSSSSIVLTSISNDLIPLTTNTYNLGSTTKFWNNAYINNLRASNRVYQDINSGPLYEINSTVQTWEWHRTNALSLGKSLATILSVEQNEKVKNLLAGSAAFIGGKRTTNSATAGGKTSADWQWVNGDIWSYTNFANGEPNNIAQQYIQIYADGTWDDVGNISMRAVYMSYGGNDISWNAVNGYYGLAKDAYPSLNPQSSGVLAVSSWISRNAIIAVWWSVCWSPELGIFLAVGNGGSLTSPNGITWNNQSGGAGFFVCWSPELRIFVSVSQSIISTSPNGIVWSTINVASIHWVGVCWSPELRIFVAVARDGTLNKVMTSQDGISWIPRTSANENNGWRSVCWSPELGLFVAVANSGTVTNRVMTSSNGIIWTGRLSANEGNGWHSVCWSKELGLFVAVAFTGTNRVMTSSNGITWTGILSPNTDSNAWRTVCWSKELRLFVAVAENGSNRVMSSPNGRDWTMRLSSPETAAWSGICWSPELGIFAAVAWSGVPFDTTNRVMTSSLKVRPPTSYNVFDSSFNSIDETGKWTFLNMEVKTLTVTGTFTNTSDDRLKHNEVIITNGLDVIDKLNPKFYQKTQTLLDASYNGDLSGQAWTYEAGLIAQELLQIPDLSFAVCGGDYYQESYILKNQSNDISTNYYDISRNYYDISTNYINRANYYDTSANYDISYNLITQPYSLNYTSIYVYVFAAIKELHAKVKAQETAIYNRQAIINNCITRIETLEQRNQV